MSEEEKPEAAKAEKPAPAEAKPEENKPAAQAASAPEGAGTEGGAPEAAPRRKETDEEKAARRKAALEAREAAKVAAAQAAAQAAQAGGGGSAAAAARTDGAAGEPGQAGAEAPVKPPSPNQPHLDRAAQLLRELISPDCVEEAYINEPNDHMPTLVVKNGHWPQAARLFREHAELGCAYLRNVSGVDYETYMEVVYYPLNMEGKRTYCLKVRTERDNGSVASVTPVWQTANWNEREIYDLLGIDFPGHPDLRRIMMPDDWIGHPLRKDYVPFDPEV